MNDARHFFDMRRGWIALSGNASDVPIGKISTVNDIEIDGIIREPIGLFCNIG